MGKGGKMIKVTIKKIFDAKQATSKTGNPYIRQGFVVTTDSGEKTVSTMYGEEQALPVKEGDTCHLNITENKVGDKVYYNVKFAEIFPEEGSVQDAAQNIETKLQIEPKQTPELREKVELTPPSVSKPDIQTSIIRQHSQKVAIEIVKLYLSLSPNLDTLVESDITNMVCMQAEILEEHVGRKNDGLVMPRKVKVEEVVEKAKEIFNADVMSDDNPF